VSIDLDEILDPAHCALVLQEVQRGVVGESSVLPALAAAARRTKLVEHCSALARAARAVGVPVVHCTAETRDDGLGANRNARLFAGVAKSPIALSPGSDAVIPAIEVESSDLVLVRHQGLGAMAGTELDAILRNEGVAAIVGVGVSLNLGMLDFAFDAVNAGYQFVMPRDAVAGVPGEYAAALLEHTFPLVATLVDTDGVIAAWAR
jgi:biuret amidohydrolase